MFVSTENYLHFLPLSFSILEKFILEQNLCPLIDLVTDLSVFEKKIKSKGKTKTKNWNHT